MERVRVNRRGNAVATGRCMSAAALLVLVVACGTARETTGLAEFPVRLTVANNLIAPITISVDGVPVVGLKGGVSSSITVSSSARQLIWTSAKPMDTNGRLIEDDIGEVKIALGSIGGLLEIGNVIDNQTFITARILNYTNVPVSIGVSDGAYVSCGVPLPAATGGIRGFTQTGYYRLLPTTEIRAYRDPTRCTGPYTSWPSSELRAFSPASGLIVLGLDSPP